MKAKIGRLELSIVFLNLATRCQAGLRLLCINSRHINGYLMIYDIASGLPFTDILFSLFYRIS